MELWLTVNGKRVSAGSQLDPLTRAVVISLFTHRRADPDDNADVPMGWWGDTAGCRERPLWFEIVATPAEQAHEPPW